MRILTLVVTVTVLGLTTNCRSTETATSTNSAANKPTAQPSAASATSVKARLDACTLLSSDDIKAVQAEAPTQAQRSDRAERGYLIAQCYYALPTSANSIVLNVTTRGEGDAGSDPRGFWNQTFAANKTNDRERESNRNRSREAETRDSDEEKAEAAPEKVPGLGDDAYWIASRVGGALYVLKKDKFFRISVGGADDAKTKLKKSKMLAEKILPRL